MIVNKSAHEMTWQEVSEWAHGVIMFIRIGGDPNNKVVEDWVSAYESKIDSEKA